MTAAETLLRAARVLREAAGKATPGTWRAEFWATGDPRPTDAHHVSAYVRDDFGPRWTALVASCTESATSNGPNAAYIALMGPTVGLAVAEWLEAEAREYEAADGGMYAGYDIQGFIAGDYGGDPDPAILVARAIVGETTAENGPDRAPGEVSGGGRATEAGSCSDKINRGGER